jgi:lipopolysaccharide biosynthesis protein
MTTGTESSGPNARAVAMYLPQFHPIPENDAWWGPGFTEWTNTAKARPLFAGHEQPILPADLGFYDLRLPESREAQAELARRSGIEAFCYWHYWFGGKRILQRPFDEVLRSGRPTLPFCLGWANQTWTGIWHGAPGRVLIEQTYPPGDDQAHFDEVVAAFRDERYLRVGGRPVFYLYSPREHPDPAAFVDRWQDMARAAGLPGLYLVAEISDFRGDRWDYGSVHAAGFDAGVYLRLPVDGRAIPTNSILPAGEGPEVYAYADTPVEIPDDPFLQPGVIPNWDNSPRSGHRGLVLTGATPEKFRTHLRAAVDVVADRAPQERFVWIKSWNEWAEGNHLEPDLVFGHGWLDVIRDELTRPAP